MTILRSFQHSGKMTTIDEKLSRCEQAMAERRSGALTNITTSTLIEPGE